MLLLLTIAESFTVSDNLRQGNAWIKFNLNETGFYRVNYPTFLWQQFTKELSKGSSMVRVHAHLFKAFILLVTVLEFYFYLSYSLINKCKTLNQDNT